MSSTPPGRASKKISKSTTSIEVAYNGMISRAQKMAATTKIAAIRLAASGAGSKAYTAAAASAAHPSCNALAILGLVIYTFFGLRV